MKRTVISLSCLVIGLFISNVARSQTPAAQKDIAAGKLLVSKSDCFACHKADAKLVGPAYVDVAKKYPASEANITLLSSKIIKGGSGTWGQIPMAAHPGISQADAKQMVKYILSLAPAKKK